MQRAFIGAAAAAIAFLPHAGVVADPPEATKVQVTGKYREAEGD